jgi:hypothetical protein
MMIPEKDMPRVLLGGSVAQWPFGLHRLLFDECLVLVGVYTCPLAGVAIVPCDP